MTSGTAKSRGIVVSIVTIVRNDRAGIAATIESVSAQSYSPIEYVIIDGASTDGTVDVIKRNESQVAFWSTEPDAGVAAALNKGIARANGDVLLFLNAGDTFIHERSVEEAIALIPTQEPLRDRIFYCDAFYVHSNGRTLLRADHAKLGHRNSLCHQSVFVGADVQRANQYDERLSIFMDYDLWLRLLPRHAFIRLPTTLSNFHAGGVSGGGSGAQLIVERAIVRLLNGQLQPTVRSLAITLGEAFVEEFKRRIRGVVGPTRYVAMKRLAGRRTPASWLPSSATEPSRAAEGPTEQGAAES